MHYDTESFESEKYISYDVNISNTSSNIETSDIITSITSNETLYVGAPIISSDTVTHVDTSIIYSNSAVARTFDIMNIITSITLNDNLHAGSPVTSAENINDDDISIIIYYLI